MGIIHHAPQISKYCNSYLQTPHIPPHLGLFNSPQQSESFGCNRNGNMQSFPHMSGGVPPTHSPFQLNSSEQFMSTSFLMSVIASQAQQIEILLQHYKQDRNVSHQGELNMNPMFLSDLSSQHSKSDLSRRSTQLQTEHSTFSATPSSSNFLQPPIICTPKGSGIIPSENVGCAKENTVPSTSHLFNCTSTLRADATASTICERYDRNQTNKFGLDWEKEDYSHETPDNSIVSLNDYTDDTMDTSDNEDKETKYMSKERKSTSGYKKVKSNSEVRPRRKTKIRTSKTITNKTKKIKRKNNKVDPVYRPPYRISRMLFLPRMLPFRNRHQPQKFGNLLHWNCLSLKTIIEKKSNYKRIEVIHKESGSHINIRKHPKKVKEYANHSDGCNNKRTQLCIRGCAMQSKFQSKCGKKKEERKKEEELQTQRRYGQKKKSMGLITTRVQLSSRETREYYRLKHYCIRRKPKATKYSKFMKRNGGMDERRETSYNLRNKNNGDQDSMDRSNPNTREDGSHKDEVPSRTEEEIAMVPDEKPKRNQSVTPDNTTNTYNFKGAKNDVENFGITENRNQMKERSTGHEVNDHCEEDKEKEKEDDDSYSLQETQQKPNEYFSEENIDKMKYSNYQDRNVAENWHQTEIHCYLPQETSTEINESFTDSNSENFLSGKLQQINDRDGEEETLMFTNVGQDTEREMYETNNTTSQNNFHQSNVNILNAEYDKNQDEMDIESPKCEFTDESILDENVGNITKSSGIVKPSLQTGECQDVTSSVSNAEGTDTMSCTNNFFPQTCLNEETGIDHEVVNREHNDHIPRSNSNVPSVASCPIPDEKSLHITASRDDLNGMNNDKKETTLRFPNGLRFKVVKYVPPEKDSKLSRSPKGNLDSFSFYK